MTDDAPTPPRPGIKPQAPAPVDDLPEAASREDLMHRIDVREAIEAGLADSDAGRVHPVADVRAEFVLPWAVSEPGP